MTASEVYIRSARGFLDEQNRVSWPQLVQAVKHLIKLQELPDATRSSIKNWLKATDPAVALMGLTVIETLAVNSPVRLRQQMAGPKWMERFSKQLAKPQSPVVLRALLQMLVDFAHMFSHEELGIASQGLVSQPHSSWAWMLEGTEASQEAQDILSDWTLGVPPVGPYRGPDYTQLLQQPAMHTGTSHLARSSCQPHQQQHNNTGHSHSLSVSGPSVSSVVVGASGVASDAMLQSVSACEVGSHASRQASRLSTRSSRGAEVSGHAGNRSSTHPDNQKVTVMLTHMASHAHELRQLCSTARATAASIGKSGIPLVLQYASHGKSDAGPKQLVPTLPPALAGHVDKGYQAAERCASWRSKVQELCQTLTDPATITQLLSSLDVINAALADWQRYASGGELFAAAGLKGDLAAAWRQGCTTPTTQPQLLLDLDDSPQHKVRQPQQPASHAGVVSSSMALPGSNAHHAGLEELSASLVASWPNTASTGGNPFAAYNSGSSSGNVHGNSISSTAVLAGSAAATASTASHVRGTTAGSTGGVAGLTIVPPQQPTLPAYPAVPLQATPAPRSSAVHSSSISGRYPGSQNTGASITVPDTPSPHAGPVHMNLPSPSAPDQTAATGGSAAHKQTSADAAGLAGPGVGPLQAGILNHGPAGLPSARVYQRGLASSQPARSPAPSPHHAGACSGPLGHKPSSHPNLLAVQSAIQTTAVHPPLQTTAVELQTAAPSSPGDTAADFGKDWQTKLTTILADAPTKQVGLKLEGQLRALLGSMQAHYEEQLAGVKEKAIQVVRQLKQEVAQLTAQQQQQQSGAFHAHTQQQQQAASTSAQSAVQSVVGNPFSSKQQQQYRQGTKAAAAVTAATPTTSTSKPQQAQQQEWVTWHGGEGALSDTSSSSLPNSTSTSAAAPTWNTWHGGELAAPGAGAAARSQSHAAHSFDPFQGMSSGGGAMYSAASVGSGMSAGSRSASGAGSRAVSGAGAGCGGGSGYPVIKSAGMQESCGRWGQQVSSLSMTHPQARQPLPVAIIPPSAPYTGPAYPLPVIQSRGGNVDLI